MIRPIKIFLYFLLISLLVMLLDQWLERAGVSVPQYISELQKSGAIDSTAGLMVTEAEELTLDSLLWTEADTLEESDSLPRKKTRLFVSDSVLTAPPLFQELFATFCRKAQDADSTRNLIRVMHLGDSQIEADRITSILRSHFQKLYGGSGPGFIMPVDPLRINANVMLSNSGNWKLSYSYRKESYPLPVHYGFSGKAAWFNDSIGSLTITPIAWKSNQIRKHPQLQLLVTPPPDTSSLKTFIDGEEWHDTIKGSPGQLKLLRYQAALYPKKISFHFEGDVSPIIHGITLDNPHGVAVDNIPMRGRPWPGFRIASNNMLQQMARELNVGFLILQFGTNVLPTKTDNYNFYRIHFLRELRLIRKLLPEVPVLVIGVQAAAESENGEMVAMEHAQLISEAQKAATLACDMAFFDLHKTMGGTKGAIEWSNQSPSLMLSDRMHFSKSGARIVGDRIWAALDSLRSNLLPPSP